MCPIIGITSYMKETGKGDLKQFGGKYVYISSCFYSEKVEIAGGSPVLLPVVIQDAAALADKLDGVVFSGGEDIEPKHYNENESGAKDSCPQRDEMELRLFKAFYDARKPILCICRGVQLMNVFFGGNLIQDISANKGYLEHARYDTPFDGVHSVSVLEGTLSRKLLGEKFPVNSLHHQSVKELGEGLLVSAYAEDGIIEAIERPGYENFMLGVQWHPERLNNDKLEVFKALVSACSTKQQ